MQNRSVGVTQDRRTAFVAIDTCGGGNNFMAIVSGVYEDDGTLLIIAADTTPVTSDRQLEDEIHSHAAGLRAMLGAYTEMVSVIEANYGGWVQASRVARLLDDHKPTAHLTVDRETSATVERRIGVFTTAEVKERMRHELQRLLREDKVAFASDARFSRDGDRAELLNQLRRCEYIYKPTIDSATKARRRVISGKMNGKNDDMAVAMMMLAYWPVHYYNTRERGVVRR
ncbi:hypothetical protein CYMTET_14293 [Cymbomonas tetramitiformis]|uniref:Uncharacterized protein n=2 Tax=Cymbomonas tetramitiformis TaxID=36881 RepID=A0AAE0BQP6_9CHLO|nr:hypothetical protein CYMTET_49755 [Cymbomonas tetramitiformis]KAK3277710.1 hypothetical protein CYMTET_14293 [Cymbomonas tetramitiformis]